MKAQMSEIPIMHHMHFMHYMHDLYPPMHHMHGGTYLNGEREDQGDMYEISIKLCIT